MKKTIILCILAIIIIILSYVHWAENKNQVVKGEEVALVPVDEISVEDPYEMTHQQIVWMHTLEFCESNGLEDIKILDSNNKYSYGVLMFQMDTFLREGKKYGILEQSITAEQGEKLIYDADLQEKIANRMLLDGGEGNWYNCWKGALKSNYPKK